MRIAVIGSGGREHAIVRALKKSPLCTKLYAMPGNGGMACDAECLPEVGALDIDAVTKACKEHAIDFVVVTPDDPLALGMVDALTAQGILCFGPKQAAARIESSKVFSKNLMQKYGIPTARYEVFTDATAAMDAILARGEYPVVIKADGLALGKGVFIPQTEQEAREALKQLMEDKIFGKSGDAVVVEEFLTGPEVSVLCFTDGKTLAPMVSSMDHKRAQDGDCGPNTGGMGTIAPNPYYTPEIAQRCMEEIFLPTIRAMEQEGCPFSGCLYFGLMLTPGGPKVIEYNCRFGDPETQVVLPLFKGDLLEVMLSVSRGELRAEDVRFSDSACACVILASGGYPGSYEKGKRIEGLKDDGQLCGGGATAYHAGTAKKEDGFYTSGGRVLGITACADTLEKAIERAYQAADTVAFEGVYRRGDIGRRALLAQSGAEETRQG